MRTKDKKTILIIVAAHKPYEMPEDAIYYPLHVGAAGADQEELSRIPFPGDDTGDQISDKNDNFCELTGLYWAWKNRKADYYGLVHYRRYFAGKKIGNRQMGGVLHEGECRKILEQEGCRVILPKKRRYYIESLYSHYQHTHYEEHLIKTRSILEQRCPEYLPSFDRVMQYKEGYMFNMFVMEKSLTDAYCSWLFPILFELERQVQSDQLTGYQGRYCGRIGELLLNVWLDHRLAEGSLKSEEVKELPVLSMEKTNWVKKGSSFLMAKYMGKKYEKSF